MKDKNLYINLSTGKIKKVETPEGGETRIICRPKSNCKKCHGRGFNGRVAITGAPIPRDMLQPCPCVYRKKKGE